MLQKGKLKAAIRRADRVLYWAFSALLTLLFARAFYGYMRVQTGGEWSAPVDEAFTYFNYARSIARGYLFEWSEGNGFSSGNGNFTYPLILAAGYWAGLRESFIVVWAAIVACFSMWGYLLTSKRLFDDLPPFSKYLAPITTYSVGALCWAIFSGLEIALYLALWGFALTTFLAIRQSPDIRNRRRREWLLGGAGVLLVLTRPEGLSSIIVLSIAASTSSGSSIRSATPTLLRTGAPAILALSTQAAVHFGMTGELVSNATIATLIPFDPLSTTGDKLAFYLHRLGHILSHTIGDRFADTPPYGLTLPIFAAVPLFSRRTREYALILWASAIAWVLAASLDGQSGLQNTLSAMPAIAWLLLSAAMGIGLSLTPFFEWRDRTWRKLAFFSIRAAAGVVALGLFGIHQLQHFREDIWLFGRASRDIRDQGTTVGRLLRRLEPSPRRILVEEAGAITYAADLPSLDLLGLGGYRKLPLARASLHGLGASLELLERLPPADRPDYFALRPSFGDNFAGWFGNYVVEIPGHGSAFGNEGKAIYRATLDALGTGHLPRTLQANEEITDALDIADLISEAEHDYEFCWSKPKPSSPCGLTEARLLPDPTRPSRELFDAGRIIPAGQGERFRLGRHPERSARLIVRTVGDSTAEVLATVDGEPVETLATSSSQGWQELSLRLPETKPRFIVELQPKTGSFTNHHVWVAQPREASPSR